MRVMSNLVCVIAVVASGCGGGDDDWGRGKIAFRANGPSTQDAQIQSADLTIASISVTETGEDWIVVDGEARAITLSPDSAVELVVSEIDVGEYHGVKVQLASGYSFQMADGTTQTGDYPAILMYIVGGMYRYSNSGNGYADTNEYFEFTTRNGALSAQMDVEVDEKSFLVLTLEPQSVIEGAALAARVAYTSILE